MRQICTVKYQIATYSGEEDVYCDGYDDNDIVISKCKRQLKNRFGGSLPYGYESFIIIKREDYDGE